MKYIGENAIKKLISLIKGDLATKQPTITASGLLKGDGTGTITAADTQEATLVDVPNGLLKGDGTTISAAVAGTDYVVPSTALNELPGHIANGDIHVTAEEKQAWSDSDVFIATYGTTTSAEIEAAYQAGKVVACIYNGSTYTLWRRQSSTTHYLVGPSPLSNCGNFLELGAIPFTAVRVMDDSWRVIDNLVTNAAKHASTHATGGSDPITPANIGAATMDEVNAAIQAAIGNAIGGSY